MIERSKRIELRVTSEELKQIRERMQETGISSLTAYMIRMAIHGYVLKMDLTDLKELLRLMQIAGNNLNQYAKKANETGSIYREDIEELRTAQKEILQEMRKVLEKLTAISHLISAIRNLLIWSLLRQKRNICIKPGGSLKEMSLHIKSVSPSSQERLHRKKQIKLDMKRE